MPIARRTGGFEYHPLMPSRGASHLESQRRFFAGGDSRSRIRRDSGRSTRRHLEEMLGVLGLSGGARILELGCGMGRFSFLLAERGFEVVAIDLSPDLIDDLRSADPDGKIEAVCCDAADVDLLIDGPFDAVVGFFFLHHLDDLGPTLKAAARVVRPGGVVAFCEPNGYNPSFIVQILASPNMRWSIDRGVVRMRPGVLLPAFRAVGLEPIPIRRYGFFPRFLADTGPGAAVERGLEGLRIFSPVSAFQVVAGVARG